MDTQQQILSFKEFIEEYYYDTLLQNTRKGIKSLLIDFADISNHDVDLAIDLLDDPQEGIKLIGKSCEYFDIESNIKIRIHNLPATQMVKISDIRSDHLDKLIQFQGIIRQKSDVRPKTTCTRFECPVCGNILKFLQFNNEYKEPSRCACGRKGKFTVLDQERTDAQGILIEESSDNIDGSEQPKKINLLLTGDITSPFSDKKMAPGSKVEVVGITQTTDVYLKNGAKSTMSDIFVDTSYIKALEENFYNIEISKEEEKEILRITNDPEGYNHLINSIAPSIFGYEKLKEALLLQLMGGVRKTRADGVISRGDTHILLVGDPGAAKSALLKRIAQIAPKGRYVSGKSASGVGLTAAVIKDEFTKGFALQAGAMALSNNGLVCIDEMDKMNPEDRSSMHECLENQTISISKANVQGTLIARTTVLAAANPKFGRFDPYEIIAGQIDMPPTLINRFDLIFVIKDVPNKERDKLMTKHILNFHKNPNFKEPEIPTSLLRKFIAYARQRVQPELTARALEAIEQFYLEMRDSNSADSGEIKPIPISARQLEALVRLSEASAKARLSNKVELKDAQKAIELIKYCMEQVMTDKDTGKIDIDRIVTGIPTVQRSLIHEMRELINDLTSKHAAGNIPIEDIYNHFPEDQHREVEDLLYNKMMHAGDIYEPRRGFIKRY